MRGVAGKGAIAAALAALLISSGAVGAAPNRLGVDGTDGASEWGLTLSKRKIDPGRALIEFENKGEDPHNLLIRRKGGSGETEIAAELDPGGVVDKLVKLRRDSRYRLWCSLQNPAPHDQLGMEAFLRVRNG